MADSSPSREPKSKPHSLAAIFASYENLVNELNRMEDSTLKLRYSRFMNPLFYDQRMDRLSTCGVPIDVQMYHFDGLLQIVSVLYSDQRPVEATEAKKRADQYQVRLSEMKRELMEIYRNLLR